MPIAIFTTWTVYGTWLPGDKRGWFADGRLQRPHLLLNLDSRLRMTHDSLILNPSQRLLVESTIIDHCSKRNWLLHACNCRTNHVHALVTAPGRDIEIPREQFKSWSTRKLNEQAGPTQSREKWWTERGWDEFIDDIDSLETVISYVRDAQDLSKR
jgi:REP element-mobilizing transposase RayT